MRNYLPWRSYEQLDRMSKGDIPNDKYICGSDGVVTVFCGMCGTAATKEEHSDHVVHKLSCRC